MYLKNIYMIILILFVFLICSRKFRENNSNIANFERYLILKMLDMSITLSQCRVQAGNAILLFAAAEVSWNILLRRGAGSGVTKVSGNF